MRAQSKYNASLLAGTSLPPARRQAAEEKFLTLLEQTFGGPSAVRGAYCECLAVRSLRAESPSGQCTAEELQAVARWEQAAAEATRLALAELKIEVRDAFFELHVWNSRTT